MFWNAVTFLGDYRLYSTLIPVIYIVSSRELGFKLMATYMFSMYINQVFKYWFMLPRPIHSLLITEAEGYGFPSGHSQASSTFWGFLALNTKLRAIKLAAIIIPLLIAYSRIHLQAHYLVDVVGGLLLGYGLPLAIHFLNISRITGRSIHILYVGCSILMIYTSTIIPGGYGYIPITSGSFIGAYIGYSISQRLKTSIGGIGKILAVILILTFIIVGYVISATLISEPVLSYIASAFFTAIAFSTPALFLRLNL
jgi:hypothetical protein